MNCCPHPVDALAILRNQPLNYESDSHMPASADLTDGILTLDTGVIRRRFHWRSGWIAALDVTDRNRDWTLTFDDAVDDVALPGLNAESDIKPDDSSFAATRVDNDWIAPPHMAATIDVTIGQLQIRRVFRLYDNCPAIACDTWLRGIPSDAWREAFEQTRQAIHAADLRNVEDPGHMAWQFAADDRLGALPLPGKHWRATAVAFHDITDRCNNLVRERSILPYRADERLDGNLLFIESPVKDLGLFILKESPCSDVQLNHPGCDFISRIGMVYTLGLGVAPDDLHTDNWTRAYSLVLGVAGSGLIESPPPPQRAGQAEVGLSLLSALRTYQFQRRRYQPDRDRMILMNTWGDRGQDSRINEAFVFNELESAARLGVTHLQLDDGWQTGKTSNSASGGGSLQQIWDNPKYWEPHPDRFPRGLAPVIERAKKLNIEIGIWFNPSTDDHYASWRRDADVLIGLYRSTGVRVFKIDGMMVRTKQAESNIRSMFDAVVEATQGNVVFNLDVTAGRRFGYHWFNEYGNLFLENRYTDWSNYHPHWTLRNLWRLCPYVPARLLQIEFLNVWRNAGNYAGLTPDQVDPLAPSAPGFAYALACTLVAQPLAWFEAANLPDEAYNIAALLRPYRNVMDDLHAATTLPIGREPSGAGWTGFHCLATDAGRAVPPAPSACGHVLVFREHTPQAAASIPLWQTTPGDRLRFTPILGQGQPMEAIADAHGAVSFQLPAAHTFALYQVDRA